MTSQVLDIRYLGIEENQIAKLTEGHLTSEGLRWVTHTYYSLETYTSSIFKAFCLFCAGPCT